MTKKIAGDYELPLHLFHQGNNFESYRFFGCHEGEKNGKKGHFFRVWAPNAKGVSLVGDFNNWDETADPLEKIADTEVWEIFKTGLKQFDTYKYAIDGCDGKLHMKADPYGTHMEVKPSTGSKVFKSAYKWTDDEWQEKKKQTDVYKSPMNIYEVHFNSWKQCTEGKYFSYPNFAKSIIPYLKEMSYTHIEFMPLAEFPFDGSWGYQGIGYYAPSSRYGTPDDFKAMIDLFHNAGISVILDWVPAHFPKDEAGLYEFDGGCVYEYDDPKKRDHLAWGTRVFDYGKNEVVSFLVSNALYWIEQYHVDGLRVDAVASMLYLDYGKRDGEWVANIYGGNENLEAVEMLKHLNSINKKLKTGALMIAEESTAWPKVTGELSDDGLGFDYKWNMGWMNDFTEFMRYDPYFRGQHYGELTFSMIYAYSERFMLIFSHDEVVHGKATMIGKMPGERKDKFANLRAAYGYMFTHPGKLLSFMGQDLAEFDEWNEKREIEWDLLQYDEHRCFNTYIKDLLHFYKMHPALYELDKDHDSDDFKTPCSGPSAASDEHHDQYHQLADLGPDLKVGYGIACG